MHALTERQIRSCFVNASKGEITKAPTPDLGAVDWDSLDLLGWTDPKAPQRAYVVVPTEAGPVGLALRTQSSGNPKPALCDWCQDPKATDGVVLYAARRSGPRGRDGNTIGAMIHADLSCSTHARRQPTFEERGRDPELFVAQRIEGLRERAARFAERVRDGG
jgi:hypothetical protein